MPWKNEPFVAKICKYALYERAEGFCCAARKPANPCQAGAVVIFDIVNPWSRNINHDGGGGVEVNLEMNQEKFHNMALNKYDKCREMSIRFIEQFTMEDDTTREKEAGQFPFPVLLFFFLFFSLLIF